VKSVSEYEDDCLLLLLHFTPFSVCVAERDPAQLGGGVRPKP